MNPVKDIAPDASVWEWTIPLTLAVVVVGITFAVLDFHLRRFGGIGLLNWVRNMLAEGPGGIDAGVAATAPGKNPDLAVWNGLGSGPIRIESNPFGAEVAVVPLPAVGRRARRKAAGAVLIAAGHTPLGPPLVIAEPAIYAVPVAAPDRR
ncbi:hypothetical protein [Tsukamurella hominis]|uniref:hypothetical protein n=1 Tax=Tsukamurella hominis TaxID=1970232 RepID=UPI0039E7B880